MDQISYSPRQIKRGMTISIWAAVLWSFYAAFVGGPIMSGLEVALSFSPNQIAFINSMGGIFVPLQLIGLYLQERFFHRTRYWGLFSYSMFSFFGLLGVLAWYYKDFHPEVGFALFACTYAGVLFSSNAIAPIGMTWHAEFVPKAASNAFWSKRNGMYMLFSMISGILSGVMLDHWGSKDVRSYTYMLLIGMLFGYISSFIQMRIPDPNPYPRKDRESPFKHIKEVAKHRTFRTVTLFFCLQAAGSGICMAFTNIYLIKVMQMDMKTLQILVVIAAAVSFIASYFFQIVGTKYGRKPVLVLCTLLVVCQYLLLATLFPGRTVIDDFANSAISRICALFGAGAWQFPPGVFSVLPIYLLIGLTGVGIPAAQQSLLTSQGERRIQGVAIAMFYSLIGFCSSLTGMFSGKLYESLAHVAWLDKMGMHPFNLMACCSALVFLASLLLIGRLREDGAVNTGEMMRVLITENAVRQVYQSYVMARPLTEESRVDKLTNLHGSMVSSELMADLYSPSSRVRDEAVNHLTTLDKVAPEVTAALIKLANDPELGMRVAALRALGRMKSAEAFETASNLALEPELPVSQAAVFALGMIGNPDARPTLRKLLESRKSSLLHAAAAEALSRIGGVADAQAIFRAYLGTGNEVLTLQTLLALARVWSVSDKSQAFKQFDAELRSPGAGIEVAIRALCASKLWEKSAAPKADLLTEMFDSGKYEQLARKIIFMLLDEFGIGRGGEPNEAAPSKLLTPSGEWKSPPFTPQTATLGVLVSMWGELANRPDPRFDRLRLFALITGACCVLEPESRQK